MTKAERDEVARLNSRKCGNEAYFFFGVVAFFFLRGRVLP
jgi:hypothetical protein